MNSANQSLSYLQQQLWSQSAEIQELTDILKEAGIIIEPTEANEPESDNEGAVDEDSDSSDSDSGSSTEPSTEIPDNTTSADPVGTTDEPSVANPTNSSEEGVPSNE